MDTPSLAQMRIRLNERKNPDFMSGIGLDQALDMSPKMYMNPDPKSKGMPAVGGVSDSSGLPVGGDLEYADELTLGRALEGRREIEG